MRNRFFRVPKGSALVTLFSLGCVWVGLFFLIQNAEAQQLCSRAPEGRHFAEAELLRAERFSNPRGQANGMANYTAAQRKRYEAWIIGCNRKNDDKSKKIEDGFRADHIFDDNIPARTIKGYFNYQSLFALRQRYAYQLERRDQKWIVTVPIKFDWPDERMTDMVDIPSSLARTLRLMRAGEVCEIGSTVFRADNPRRVEKGFIAWEFTADQLDYIHEWQNERGHDEDLQVTEPINSRRDYNNLPQDARSRSIFTQDWWDIAVEETETSCRVSRSLTMDNPATTADDTMSILGHLRVFWKTRIPSFWNLPSRNGEAFEVRPRMIDCEGDRQKYGCDTATASELDDWKKDETVWKVRFNLRPNSRAKYKSSPIALNNIYVGSAMRVVAHELGHQLGLDDEYAYQGGERCNFILPVDALGNGGAANNYLMCDSDAARAGMQGVYAWIVTRRRVIARCEENWQCDDGYFCAKYSLNRHICERKRPNGKTCTVAKQCRSGRCNLLTCKAQNECKKDNECGPIDGVGQYCDKTGVNECTPKRSMGSDCGRKEQCQSGRCYAWKCKPLDACTKDYECGDTEYCDKGTVSFGVNRCVLKRDRGKVCIRKDQCKSNRCNWGFCARPK